MRKQQSWTHISYRVLAFCARIFSCLHQMDFSADKDWSRIFWYNVIHMIVPVETPGNGVIGSGISLADFDSLVPYCWKRRPSTCEPVTSIYFCWFGISKVVIEIVYINKFLLFGPVVTEMNIIIFFWPINIRWKTWAHGSSFSVFHASKIWKQSQSHSFLGLIFSKHWIGLVCWNLSRYNLSLFLELTSSEILTS